MTEFKGFPKEMIKFFEDLKKNNTKDWFNENKKVYEDYVKRPSEKFVMAMGEKLIRISPGIMAIPKVNQSLFRINRDTRFSMDKSPYKTNLGIWFWAGKRKRMECSGFYFHFGGGKLMVGAGVHYFTPELLKRYREAVVDKKSGPLLTKAVNQISKKGYIIGVKHYKRVPRDYDANHERAQFLLYNGLTAMIEEKIPKEFNSPSIVEYAFAHFKNMSPLHQWLISAIG
ncbi:MAG: DUF2461 domain-containing protein [Desulfobacteraceae bacterium]|nr:MAG: DUF2461 domain-containing protein [Desulfobacteraceae bacterium]